VSNKYTDSWIFYSTIVRMRKFLTHFSVIILLIVGAVLFFVPTHTAQAVEVLDTLTKFFTFSADIVYGLIGKILWWVLIPLTGKILNLIGQMIDIALSMSLTKEFYTSLSIDIAWGIIRDLCNIFFIFILIFTGVRTILGIDTSNTRHVVVSVIIGAILINFSLFLTQAVIDVSNIFTAWITNGIIALSDGSGGVSNSAMSVLQMSKLAGTQGGFDTKNWDVSLFASGVALLALNCITIYVFFKVAFLMLGRLVSLIILLIMSPLGFVGHLIPKLEKYAKDWRDELTKACLMVPMFLLLLYITLYIATKFDTVLANFRTPTTNELASGAFGIEHYVLFAIIAMMLLKSLEVAEEYTGVVAGQVGGFVKSGVGLVAGVGATRIIGGAGAAMAKSRIATSLATSNNAFARGIGDAVRTTGTFAAESNFGVKSARSGLGFDKVGVLKEQIKGAEKGYEGDIKAYQKKEEGIGKSLGEIDPKLQIARGRVMQGKDGKTGEKIQPGLIGKVIGRPLSSIYGVVSGQKTTGSAVNSTFGTNFDNTIDYNAKIGGKMESTGSAALKKERKKEASKMKEETGLGTAQRSYRQEEEKYNEQKKNLEKEISDIEKELPKYNDSLKSIDGVIVDNVTYDFRKSAIKAGINIRKKNLSDIENNIKLKKQSLETKKQEVNDAFKTKHGVDIETAEKEGAEVENKEKDEILKKVLEKEKEKPSGEEPKEEKK